MFNATKDFSPAYTHICIHVCVHTHRHCIHACIHRHQQIPLVFFSFLSLSKIHSFPALLRPPSSAKASSNTIGLITPVWGQDCTSLDLSDSRCLEREQAAQALTPSQVLALFGSSSPVPVSRATPSAYQNMQALCSPDRRVSAKVGQGAVEAPRSLT